MDHDSDFGEHKKEEEEEMKTKISFLEKFALFLFVLLPLLCIVFKHRFKRLFGVYLAWCEKNMNLLITINMVIVLFGVVLLLALQIWLSHVSHMRGIW